MFPEDPRFLVNANVYPGNYLYLFPRLRKRRVLKVMNVLCTVPCHQRCCNNMKYGNHIPSLLFFLRYIIYNVYETRYQLKDNLVIQKKSLCWSFTLFYNIKSLWAYLKSFSDSNLVFLLNKSTSMLSLMQIMVIYP